MEHTKVLDWMTPDPQIATPDTAVIDAYQMMKAYGVRRLPVMDGKHLAGMVTLNDIRRIVPMGSLSLIRRNNVLANTRIARIMTSEPITIHPDDTVAEAARLMFDYKIGGLPVMRGDRLIGIISEADLFKLLMIEAS
jgi:acetoin utilization protein AcuB